MKQNRQLLESRSHQYVRFFAFWTGFMTESGSPAFTIGGKKNLDKNRFIGGPPPLQGGGRVPSGGTGVFSGDGVRRERIEGGMRLFLLGSASPPPWMEEGWVRVMPLPGRCRPRRPRSTTTPRLPPPIQGGGLPSRGRLLEVPYCSSFGGCSIFPCPTAVPCSVALSCVC